MSTLPHTDALGETWQLNWRNTSPNWSEQERENLIKLINRTAEDKNLLNQLAELIENLTPKFREHELLAANGDRGIMGTGILAQDGNITTSDPYSWSNSFFARGMFLQGQNANAVFSTSILSRFDNMSSFTSANNYFEARIGSDGFFYDIPSGLLQMIVGGKSIMCNVSDSTLSIRDFAANKSIDYSCDEIFATRNNTRRVYLAYKDDSLTASHSTIAGINSNIKSLITKEYLDSRLSGIGSAPDLSADLALLRSDLTAETTNRIGGDASLQGQINAMGVVVGNLPPQISAVRSDLTAEIDGLRTELQSDLTAQITSVEGQIGEVRSDLTAEIDAAKDEIMAQVEAVGEDVRRIPLTISARVIQESVDYEDVPNGSDGEIIFAKIRTGSYRIRGWGSSVANQNDPAEFSYDFDFEIGQEIDESELIDKFVWYVSSRGLLFIRNTQKTAGQGRWVFQVILEEIVNDG